MIEGHITTKWFWIRTKIRRNIKMRKFPTLKAKTKKVITINAADLDEFMSNVYKSDFPNWWRTYDVEPNTKNGEVIRVSDVKRGKLSDDEKKCLKEFKCHEISDRFSDWFMLTTLLHDLVNMKAIEEGTYRIKIS